jgi:inhibitor of KinA
VTAALPRLSPLGDAALILTLGETIDARSRGLVLTLARELARHPVPGTIEVVAATTTLTIHYDPQKTDYPSARDALLPRIPREPLGALEGSGRLVEIPVRYDGPDLESVAAATRLAPDEVVRRHTGRDYEVYFLGFVPGWAYLGELDPSLVLPRRPAPRPRVPAGSVAIAGVQTGVYPAETPGGWHLIGRTRVAMFDPSRDPPSLLATGDRVRFVAETS